VVPDCRKRPGTLLPQTAGTRWLQTPVPDCCNPWYSIGRKLTGLPAEVVQGFAQTVGARLPIKRFGQPEEIARAAVFLASADSTFVVGSELTTDGGLSINGL
jgi:NAD(P)-dependent dehydrogenase (short-subunit alcohol dehydrogenase family)